VFEDELIEMERELPAQLRVEPRLASQGPQALARDSQEATDRHVRPA
jgi:hypothetical protein